MGSGGDQTKQVTVKVNHGERVMAEERGRFGRRGGGGAAETFVVDVSPEDTVKALKERVSAAVSKSALSADDIQLSFGPSEKLIGKRFFGDPLVDEEATLVKQYTFLEWLDQFPHWHLTARLQSSTPPPPGVAIAKAAASAEKEDPERAVEAMYASGELVRPEDLPAPWGDKGLDVYKRDPLVRSIGDNPLPPSYRQASQPSNMQSAAKAGAGWEPSDVDHVPNVLDLS